MDYITKNKIKEFLTLYLEGNEEIIIKLSEINKEYAELFPLIKDISINVFGSALSQLEKNYEELEKRCIRYNDIEHELNKIKEIYKKISKNKQELDKNNAEIERNNKELSDLLNQD